MRDEVLVEVQHLKVHKRVERVAGDGTQFVLAKVQPGQPE